MVFGHLQKNNLLKNKADVNLHPTEENIHHFIDSMGWSPLMFAAYEGHLPVVQHLLDQGANINAVGRDDTALTLALERKSEPIVQFLVKKGAHINQRAKELAKDTPTLKAILTHKK